MPKSFNNIKINSKDMFVDIVFPNNNENEYIELAKELGISNIIFCYPFSKEFRKSEQHETGVLVNPYEIGKASRSNSIILCNSNKRSVFESHIPLMIFGLESFSGYDSMHTRHSGLNHILAKLAHENEHTICFSLSSLIESKHFSMSLGRMMQNVRLCRKYNVRMKLASFAKTPYQMRAAIDMRSFGVFLGMNPGESKKALC